jgi:hypothetical protein
MPQASRSAKHTRANPQRLVGNLGYSCHVVGPAGTCGVADPEPARSTHRCAKRCALDAGTTCRCDEASGTLTSARLRSRAQRRCRRRSCWRA